MWPLIVKGGWVMLPIFLCSFFALVIMAISLSQQNKSLMTQTQWFYLEKRPYVYVDIVPEAEYEGSGDLFAGARITYHNVGETLARNIKSELMVANDKKGSETLRDIPKWYEDEYGSYPYVKTIFPNQ